MENIDPEDLFLVFQQTIVQVGLQPGLQRCLRGLLCVITLCLMVASVSGYGIYLWYLRTNEERSRHTFLILWIQFFLILWILFLLPIIISITPFLMILY